MILGHEKALWFLFAVLFVLVPAYLWCFTRKRQMLRTLAQANILSKINPSVSFKKQIFKSVLLIVCCISIIISLAEPKWNPKPKKIKRSGRDIVILLDTSRSMLAEDISPSRLGRAKIAIKDLMDTLRGDRIAIVTFAGSTAVKCPLTQDYAFVRMALDDIDTESTTRGGTMIGDAIRKATTELFDEKTEKYKDIVLITDGDDHESFPVEAAEKAGQQGIRIIAIGMGDENQGGRIPIIDETGQKTFLKYEGQEVWSKLGANTLREIAYASPQGKYLAVEPGTTLDLGQIYEDLIVSAQKRELESLATMKYDEKFQVFLALAIMLIICEALISERKKV
ncbi:MAG TPA: VWA domain-containing protein [Sedimentisphaerales bacterium]|nr:VWA domain-containing protein [Sedimentisphaerales bacterium]